MANRRDPISTVNLTTGAGHPHHAAQSNGCHFSSCILKINGQKAGKVYQLHPVVNPDSIQPQCNTVIERRPSLGVRADLCLCLLLMTALTGHRSLLDVPKYYSDRQDDRNPWGWTYFSRLGIAVDLTWSRVSFAGENRWVTVTVCLDIETVWFHGAFYVCFAFRIMSYSWIIKLHCVWVFCIY